ncbi:hypothetical protein TTHERM_00095480 (macronuclear) [Tetrahymena thermophila SB210]|uniref:Uncharacterized protein n=1 Tax=Tetrahymena thermophila (strain SB210) TaxID=312017 RepID=Q235A1_TETTS|nr:hypothetical protein TTHERM_00095480 [Tetrahymena thermophila SB210]EAR91852.2 hypothetical protein TTHERM_00095480 [Tetrahymena thermophila SB210]|eukprot:XP_001012097.2 hypothetical protein TTHERM_00095480 [Tetrahymena thermophila SB210]
MICPTRYRGRSKNSTLSFMLLIQMLIGNLEYKLIKSIRSTPLQNGQDKTIDMDINTKNERYTKIETKGDFKFCFSPCKKKQKKIIVHVNGVKDLVCNFKESCQMFFLLQQRKREFCANRRMFQTLWGMIFKEDLINRQEFGYLKF